MTQVTSAHLGESLGTDFFTVREQFTDEQWGHFAAETMQTLIVGRAITGIGAFT